jgi:hypothetical protein
MGMFRDPGSTEIDIVKEMAEGLGSTGLKLEDLLEKADHAAQNARRLRQAYVDGSESLSEVNDAIRAYNALVDKAEDVLQWLLIQREACGFRTHKNVRTYYPIPAKMKLFSP